MNISPSLSLSVFLFLLPVSLSLWSSLSFFIFYSTAEYPALSLSFPSPPVILSGDPVNLTCVIDKLTIGYTNQPELIWYGPRGNELVTNGNTTIRSIRREGSTRSISVFHITEVKSSDAGEYLCVGRLATSAYTSHSLYISKEEPLPVQSNNNNNNDTFTL